MQKDQKQEYQKGERVLAAAAGSLTCGAGTIVAGPDKRGLYAVQFDEHGLRDSCKVLWRAEP